VLNKNNDWPRGLSEQMITRREGEVVHLVSQGLPNKLVAKELGVREGTVKIHLHSIYRKLRVSNRTELILRILSNGQKLPNKRSKIA